jgi:hypothetical protein
VLIPLGSDVSQPHQHVVDQGFEPDPDGVGYVVRVAVCVEVIALTNKLATEHGMSSGMELLHTLLVDQVVGKLREQHAWAVREVTYWRRQLRRAACDAPAADLACFTACLEAADKIRTDLEPLVDRKRHRAMARAWSEPVLAPLAWPKIRSAPKTPGRRRLEESDQGDWSVLLDRIRDTAKRDGISLARACAEFGLSPSQYYRRRSRADEIGLSPIP